MQIANIHFVLRLTAYAQPGIFYWLVAACFSLYGAGHKKKPNSAIYFSSFHFVFFFQCYCYFSISVVFRVRSAKAVKITDATLLKRLGIICLCVGIGLLVRTIVAPPVVIVGRTADDLKAFLCKADWWDHTFTSSKYIRLPLVT